MGNQLLIIGNGYDLACGLETRFSDFLKHLKLSKFDINSNFWTLLFDSAFFTKDDYLKKNTQDYLGISELKNWADFELVLNRFLFSSELYSIAESFYLKRFNYLNALTGIKEVLRCYFSNLIYNPELQINFVAFLGEQLWLFETLLVDYLTKIESHVVDNDKEHLIKQLTKDSECKGILSFNYTNPLPNGNDLSVTYIHGSTKLSRDIVIGVDFTKSICKDPLNYKNIGEKKIFTKTYRKMVLDHDRFGESLKLLENNYSKITFFGHSLGEQDYSYFQSIFDHFNIYDSNIVLEFFYSDYDRSKKECSRTIDRVYKLINEYGETLANKDHGKNLLHKMLLEERIIIQEIFSA